MRLTGKPIDGTIHHFLEKVGIKAYKDGTFLLLDLMNGQTAKIAWVDEKGEPIKGEPVLWAVDVKIQLAGLEMEGEAEMNGHLFEFGKK